MAEEYRTISATLDGETGEGLDVWLAKYPGLTMTSIYEVFTRHLISTPTGPLPSVQELVEEAWLVMRARPSGVKRRRR